jgi:integrase/recombinase XerD
LEQRGQNLLCAVLSFEKESEVVFLTQKLANGLKNYIRKKEIDSEERIFPLTYTAARAIVRKAGQLVGIKLRPHDLRRSSAT